MKECTILLATHNKHKVEEIRAMLQGYSQSVVYKVLSLDALPEKVEIVEDRTTFEENALAQNVSLIRWLFCQKSNVIEELFFNEEGWLLADDSGLEVDALQGAPGIYSARFAASELGTGMENSPDEANNAKLLRELDGIPIPSRQARFRCVMALTPVSNLADPSDLIEQTEFFSGSCEGHIALEGHGKKGFGYDPLFIPDGYTRSFAELGEAVKNSISHRFKALKNLANYLNQKYRQV